MGQRPFHWAMSDGYPDRASAWAVSMLGRWNFAVALVTGDVEGTTADLDALARALGAAEPAEVTDGFTSALLGRRLPAAQREQIVRLAAQAKEGDRRQQVAAAVLASPEFQWR